MDPQNNNVEEGSLEHFIDEGLKAQAVFKQLAEKNAILIHKVFSQTDPGRELLDKWKNDLIMVPSVLPHYTQFEAGIAEGAKMFIRNIISQIETVEKDDNE